MFLCVIVLYFIILVYNIRRHQQGGIDMQDKFNKGPFDSDKMLSCRTCTKPTALPTMILKDQL